VAGNIDGADTAGRAASGLADAGLAAAGLAAAGLATAGLANVFIDAVREARSFTSAIAICVNAASPKFVAGDLGGTKFLVDNEPTFVVPADAPACV
jgi:hypothetical protein